MTVQSACFNGGLVAYLAGALGALAGFRNRKVATFAAFGFALTGALLEVAASLPALVTGSAASWSLPSGIPVFAWTVRLDPLSAFFNLALSLLAASVSIYSLGYVNRIDGRRSASALGFFYNVLLMALTLVFAAADVFTFLVAWELMALSAYFLVTFEHEKEETRRAGVLFLVMSHAGTGMLMIAFLLLASASGSLGFSSFHSVASGFPAVKAGVVFLLFLAGFGVKAGIIPIHIWLPAAHPVAPSNISALMSGIVIKTGIYGLARVFFDFYGASPLWAGALVLGIGVASAVLGVLYALMEHDLKRLLAYHSIENIGIILIGFGLALMFRSLGHPGLAAMALIAGLYHALNHAIFKCLLFLGAGAVLQATHTRNMEEMGGLIRRMPATAACFLIGAVAISGLPPLNGFVSEWLTYQALLAGFATTTTLSRIIYPIAGSLLALTAALAAACFVKAFGISFLALPRSEAAQNAREAPASMRIGMYLLAGACFVLGVGASWLLPLFDSLTEQLMGVGAGSSLTAVRGFGLSAGSLRGGTVSTAGIAAVLVALSALPALFWLAAGRKLPRRVGPTWDCGLPGLRAENEYTATAFSKPIRMIFSALFRPRREIQAEYEVSAYYPTAIRFQSEIEPAFEKYFYNPLRAWILSLARGMRGLQAGSIHAYLAYMFVTLILLLLFGVRG